MSLECLPPFLLTAEPRSTQQIRIYWLSLYPEWRQSWTVVKSHDQKVDRAIHCISTIYTAWNYVYSMILFHAQKSNIYIDKEDTFIPLTKAVVYLLKHRKLGVLPLVQAKFRRI